MQIQNEYCVEPKLPRNKEVPQRYEIENENNHFLKTPYEMYERWYFEVIDLAVNAFLNDLVVT